MEKTSRYASSWQDRHTRQPPPTTGLQVSRSCRSEVSPTPDTAWHALKATCVHESCPGQESSSLLEFQICTFTSHLHFR
eukprot:scaffold218132_cov22-Tisochrysis_lutea.AAC.1